MERLTTERLILRAWEESDAFDLFKYASDPEVGPRVGWPPHKSIEESLEIIRTVFSGDGLWAVELKETSEVIGCVGYLPAECSNLDIEEVYHITTSDGVVLYVHVKGQGEPCLYLHGGPGAGSTWMEKMGGKELEKRYTMIYLDQRGVCKSTEPADDNFALKSQTMDFEEVRKALGFDQWYVLGHSFGGILEIAYWRDYPKSIKGMIFEDCTLSMNDCLKDSWLPAAIEIVGEENVDPMAKDTTLPCLTRMAAIQKQLTNEFRALIFTCEENRLASDTLNSWTFHKDCLSHGKGDMVMGIDDYWEDFRPFFISSGSMTDR